MSSSLTDSSKIIFKDVLLCHLVYHLKFLMVGLVSHQKTTNPILVIYVNTMLVLLAYIRSDVLITIKVWVAYATTVLTGQNLKIYDKRWLNWAEEFLQSLRLMMIKQSLKIKAQENILKESLGGLNKAELI